MQNAHSYQTKFRKSKVRATLRQLSSTVMLAQCRPLLNMLHIRTDHSSGKLPNDVAGTQVSQTTDFIAKTVRAYPIEQLK
jgi:hypothetical protein